MTEIQKLERRTKRAKYISIFIACICTMILIYGMIFVAENSTNRSFVEKVMVQVIIMLGIMAENYTLYWHYTNIKKYNKYLIDNEYLKESIPQKYSLTTDNFVEICLDYDKENEDPYKRNIRANLEDKYYAKIISYDEIEVIHKDKNGDLIEKPLRVTNFHYFEARFKPL